MRKGTSTEGTVKKGRYRRTGTNGQEIVTGNMRTGKRSAGNRRTGNRNRSKITSLELFNIVHNKKFIKKTALKCNRNLEFSIKIYGYVKRYANYLNLVIQNGKSTFWADVSEK